MRGIWRFGEAAEGVLREDLVGTSDEVAVVNTANGDDDVKAMGEDLGPGVMPNTWDPSKVYLYEDPDGNKVPVPYGFTVSGAESEKYVNHNVTKTGTLTELTWSSSGDYAWTQNASDGIWSSGNYHVASSTSELVSDEITVGEDGGYLSIEWSVSSGDAVNKRNLLSITIINTNTGTSEMPINRAGTMYGSDYNSLIYRKYNVELKEGKYTISLKYTKQGDFNYGLDRGYVKGGTLLNYDSTGEDEVTIHQYGGLVVYEGTEAVTDSNVWNESKNRNQFVWVPVSDTSRIYETDIVTGKKKAKLYNFGAAERTQIDNYSTINGIREPGVCTDGYGSDILRQLIRNNLQEYSKNAFYKELQLEFDKCMNSIEKYGGFYIGRYETGNISTNSPVIKRMNSDLINQSWYTMYNKMKNISSNENIQTGIIWGCLFDETLQWLIDSKAKTKFDIARDSTEWGNYINTSFLCKDIDR